MPYDRSIGKSIHDILNLPEIQQTLSDPSNYLSREYLRSLMEVRQESILADARSEVTAFDSLEAEINDHKAQLANASVSPRVIRYTVGTLGATAVAVFYAVVFGGIATLFDFIDPLSWWAVLRASFPVQWVALLVVIWLVFVAIWAIYWFARTLPGLRQRFVKEFQLDTAEERLNSARIAADKAVFKSALQNATLIINETRSSFFQNQLYVPTDLAASAPPHLRATTGRGLSEVLNPLNEVATQVRRDLLLALQTLPGASIGISGPRGVGKSTLLSSLCTSNIGKDGNGVVGFYTSAPVEYDGRDFLLHIFSGVCEQVLRLRGIMEGRKVALEDHEEHHHRGKGPFVDLQARAGWVLLASGILLTGIGLIAAAAIVDMASHSSASRVVNVAPPGGPPASVKEPIQVPKDERPQAAPAPKGEPSRYAEEFQKVLEFKPGALVQWGAMAFTIGLVLVIMDQLSRRQEGLALIRKLLPANRRQDGQADELDQLVIACQRNLRDIHFQRSFTSGWSGSLKMPVGIETSTSGAISLAQRQQSFPELVQRLREFLQLVTAEYARVVIGIDELDKLESDDKARQFLNEIKAVFNIPNCFYLVSVSESAISHFERRGLPFRDAFDSAFDDIYHVDLLTLEGSRALLGRRVLNFPDPFLGFCHCVAAGLPRDLIRTARTVLDVAAKSLTPIAIGDLAITLLTKEIAAKHRATKIAARDIPLDPEVGDFLVYMLRVEMPVLHSNNLEEWQPARRDDLTDEDKERLRRLKSLAREFEGFRYFASTGAQIFGRIRESSDWQMALERGWIDYLAKARQALEINPETAKVRLKDLRLISGLQEIVWVSPQACQVSMTSDGVG